MSEDRTDSLNEHSTNPTPFERYVMDQFELILTRLDGIESGMRVELSTLRTEMVERFVQISRQVRHLDEKVDLFIREHVEIKQEMRELRDTLVPKN